MALSRTARILIAVLLLAAAGFFWLNYFQQNDVVETSPTPVPAATPGTAAPLTSAPVLPGGAPANGIVTTPEEASPASGVASTDTSAPADPEAATPTPVGTAAPVVVTEPPAVVLRDLVVDQLPFLVTEPPQVAADEELEGEEDAGRSLVARANVNPFSPILVQAPPAAQQPLAGLPTSEGMDEPEIVIVNGDGEPGGTANAGGASTSTPAARMPVAAPAPRAVAPASSRTGELPRPLPSGTLSAVPDILRDARTQPSASAGPANLGTVAALVVPTDDQGASLPFAASEAQVAAATAPEPIGPGHVQEQPAAQAVTPTLPVAVGVDALSRYLRDNNVKFTGQVLGPLSVGVFRSNLYQQPAVVMLGQTLPDSEILLSDLRGYEARFTLGQNTQVLSLDTRR